MNYNLSVNLDNEIDQKNDPASERKLVISIDEMAKMLSISRPFAYKLSHQADFPVIVLGKRRLINVAALQCWLNKHMNNGGMYNGKEAC